jgi:ketosteroid isomerase-like protein
MPFTDTTSIRANWVRTESVRHAVLLALLLVGSPVHGADPPDKALIAKLTAQADAWDKAIVRKDRAAVAANMSEDFRQIDKAGNVETKASFLDGVLSPDLEIDPYTVEDFDVRVYGDVALLSGRTRMTGRYQKKPFTSHYRYIDIYVRGRDGWRIVSVQISPIPTPPAQGAAADEAYTPPRRPGSVNRRESLPTQPSSDRHRYQHATDRYGRQASAVRRMRSGLGSDRQPYAFCMALRIP